ncbi:hypothetical protein NQZ68_002477 [Dissostichus eleginoides]|nr:hypothetical protein NQZ68_002477 [Dissostichus eleginoides]
MSKVGAGRRSERINAVALSHAASFAIMTLSTNCQSTQTSEGFCFLSRGRSVSVTPKILLPRGPPEDATWQCCEEEDVIHLADLVMDEILMRQELFITSRCFKKAKQKQDTRQYNREPNHGAEQQENDGPINGLSVGRSGPGPLHASHMGCEGSWMVIPIPPTEVTPMLLKDQWLRETFVRNSLNTEQSTSTLCIRRDGVSADCFEP